LFNLVTRGHTAGVHHLAVDDNSGRAHDAVAHDLAQLFNFFELDGHALGSCDFADQGDGVSAVGTARAQYLDVHGVP